MEICCQYTKSSFEDGGNYVFFSVRETAYGFSLAALFACAVGLFFNCVFYVYYESTVL